MRLPKLFLLALVCLLLAVTACDPGGSGDAATVTPGAGTPLSTASPPALTPTASAPRPDPLSAPSTQPCWDPLGCFGPPERVGAFDAERIPEASGLAASRTGEVVLYLLDDEPGETGVHVVRLDGSAVGVLTVDGMDTRDGESLAVGPCGADRAEPWCLYIGDIGDNARAREDVVLHRIPEPDLTDGVPAQPVAADTIRLRYPDGAHDAEALLIDDAGRVHLVTKAPFDRETRTTGETRLYRAETFTDGVMDDLGPLPIPSPAEPFQSLFVGEVVTGGDYRDGQVLLRTYDAVFSFDAPDGSRDLAEMATWPVREIPTAWEAQSEALTFAPGGCGFLTAGEMAGDLYLVPCRP